MQAPKIVPRHAALGHFLAQNRESILRRWVYEIARVFPTSEVTYLEWREPAPELLDALVAALARDDVDEAVRQFSQHIRSHDRGPEVGDLGCEVRRYGILGDVIRDAAEARGVRFTAHEHRVLLRCLSEAVADAVAASIRRHDEEDRRRMQAHVAFLAHELRNPLQSAQMALSVLRREGIGEAGGRIDSIRRALVHLGRMIEDLLAFHRLEDRIELHRERVEVGRLVEEACADVRDEAEARGIRVAANVEPGLEVDADPRLLRAIVSNLLGNGVKFTRANGAVALHVWREGDQVRLRVEDECDGRPFEETDEIFRPYVQGGDAPSGFGLGLAIVKHAVDAHHGTVQVEPRDGGGCAFDVRLPD